MNAYDLIFADAASVVVVVVSAEVIAGAKNL